MFEKLKLMDPTSKIPAIFLFFSYHINHVWNLVFVSENCKTLSAYEERKVKPGASNSIACVKLENLCI